MSSESLFLKIAIALFITDGVFVLCKTIRYYRLKRKYDHD